MWEILIIPIIGVGVWIISTLLRGEEEAKKPGEPGGQRKPQKVTDLDRFLREVQRRRKADEREPEPSQQVEPRREEPVPVVLVEAPVVVAEVVPPVPIARPIPQAQPLPVVVAQPLPSLAAQPLPSLAAQPIPETLPRRTETPALIGVRELLRSRDGLRKAMILSEVLGPPVSRRR
jgi:hypothetical protein